jgi:hypothetical protein
MEYIPTDTTSVTISTRLILDISSLVQPMEAELEKPAIKQAFERLASGR